MKVLASRRGFSLVELLTVIAIIAILAGIIFPVMGMVNNKARMNKCITQLHQIGLGVQMFKQDNRRYPDMLAIPVQRQGSTVIPFDRVTRNTSNLVGLYPEYVKGGAKMFHCPCSKEIDTSKADIDEAGTGWEFYSYDSYDFMRISTTQVQQHYTRSWCILANGQTPEDAVRAIIPDNAPVTGDAASDYERQLKFRTPPDNTVITWCSYHESANLTGKAPTLYLDGHVDQLDASQIEVSKWRTMPKKE